MDRNAYQSELDQVQFTEAGRSADWTRGSRRWWTPSAAACRVRSPQVEP